ncbi:YdcF family protein [Pseudocitrobacter sp. 73]|uniref:YdcF family protein n=1 Tax=Pseudocitrobacter sp. 73 TaxID=2605731 RepID=UPI0011F04A2D|nr:YdcF family protein [Pseudocitrobacter sp. 73]KAA1045563.1 YdcF family protein [Pseudocitrobacter sp. 73]
MLTTLPRLPDSTLTAANLVGSWLAQNDFASQPQSDDFEVVVLAGNAVIPVIDAACQLATDKEKTLLISGGIGHSTTYLYAAIAQHPSYNTLRTTGLSEAAILAEIAHQFWKIPRENILVENASTNCGENARFTRQMLDAQGIAVKNGIVMQDPTMQRRTMATFEHVWQDVENRPHWRSYPGCQPELFNSENGVAFKGDDTGLWPVARYLSLIIGELPRIRDDEQGYGPRGKNFIAHVDIPLAVEQAWNQLTQDVTLREMSAMRALR